MRPRCGRDKARCGRDAAGVPQRCGRDAAEGERRELLPPSRSPPSPRAVQVRVQYRLFAQYEVAREGTSLRWASGSKGDTDESWDVNLAEGGATTSPVTDASPLHLPPAPPAPWSTGTSVPLVCREKARKHARPRSRRAPRLLHAAPGCPVHKRDGGRRSDPPPSHRASPSRTRLPLAPARR